MKAGETNRFDISVMVAPKDKFTPHGGTLSFADGLKKLQICADNGLIGGFSHSACYVEEDKFVLRLFKNNADGRKAKISCGNISREFAFGKYEAKTVIFDGKDFKGKELWV